MQPGSSVEFVQRRISSQTHNSVLKDNLQPAPTLSPDAIIELSQYPRYKCILYITENM